MLKTVAILFLLQCGLLAGQLMAYRAGKPTLAEALLIGNWSCMLAIWGVLMINLLMMAV